METFATGATRSNDAYPLSQLPLDGLITIANRFLEGEEKYGLNNWQKGIPYRSMLDHALTHLHLLNQELRVEEANGSFGGLSDNHLGALGWFVCVMMWYRNHGNKAEVKDVA